MPSPSTRELPNVGEVLAPLLARLPPEQRPLLIAMAERLAAERYRGWAAEAASAAQRESLLACARREEEIASRVEALSADADALCREIRAATPEIETLNRELFAGRPVREQWQLQAGGERLGAATWRAFARDASPAAREAFHACALLEEENAVALETLLAAGA